MSVLVRFKVGTEGEQTQLKARIYEHASKKLNCKCCGERKFGVLIRQIEPRKTPSDVLICHECIVLMSMETIIAVDGLKDTYFGKFSPKEIINAVRKRKNLRRGPEHQEKVECPFCKNMFGKSGLKFHVKAKHPEVKITGLNIAEILLIKPEALEEEVKTIVDKVTKKLYIV